MDGKLDPIMFFWIDNLLEEKGDSTYILGWKKLHPDLSNEGPNLSLPEVGHWVAQR